MTTRLEAHISKRARASWIPAREALIGWNLNQAGRVSEVFVIRDGRSGEWQQTGVPARWASARYTYGACLTEWMNGSHNMTPEWIFSEIITFYGCADSDVLEEALRAFGSIEECAWARAMNPLGPKPPRPFWSAS